MDPEYLNVQQNEDTAMCGERVFLYVAVCSRPDVTISASKLERSEENPAVPYINSGFEARSGWNR